VITFKILSALESVPGPEKTPSREEYGVSSPYLFHLPTYRRYDQIQISLGRCMRHHMSHKPETLHHHAKHTKKAQVRRYNTITKRRVPDGRGKPYLLGCCMLVNNPSAYFSRAGDRDYVGLGHPKTLPVSCHMGSIIIIIMMKRRYVTFTVISTSSKLSLTSTSSSRQSAIESKAAELHL